MEASFIEIIEPEELGSTCCRCCLFIYEEDSMDNMFDCLYEDIEFHEIINILAPISISPDDGHSQFICEKCKASAIDAYDFRQKCILSNEQITPSLVQGFDEEEEELTSQQEDEFIFKISKMEDEQEIGDSGKTIKAEPSYLEIYQNEDEENLALASLDCPFCGKEFGTGAALEDHVNSEHVKDEGPSSVTVMASKSAKNRECEFCGKTFETPSKLKRHHRVHRDLMDLSELPPLPIPVKKYQCKICEKRVDTPSKLQRHLRVHEKDSKFHNGVNQYRPHPCPDCNQRFWDETKLEKHKLVHSEAFINSKISLPDDHLFTCVVCLEKVSNYENCLQHMRNHREEFGDNTEVSCKLCPKVYPKLVNLIRHSRVHPENATHQCIYCYKLMGMGEDFIEHMLRHKGFKPFVCGVEFCGKSFMKSHKLKQHMETHNGQEIAKFICDKCDKSFTNIEYLKRHLMRHSGRKEHACHLCSMRFTFKAGLNSHMSTHTKERPFSCDICTSSFSKLSALRTHQRAHAGDKRFACEICKMDFITSSHLRRHMLTHTGIKPHQCSYCEKAYAQSNDLKKHLRVHLGPNVFRCDFDDCSEAFPKFLQLKNHKLMHSSNEEGIFSEESYVEDIDAIKLL